MSDTRNGAHGVTYRQAGVNIDAADSLIRRIAPAAAATRRAGAEAELGGFGGLFDLRAAGYQDPILVASTDGVGTKLKLAIEARDFAGIGQDLVAMCVNDIVVQGAEPLFFLDYYATGKLAVDDAAVVIEGVARACRDSGCALIGGETAEMPGMYAPGDFDLAGFCVGAVERESLLPRPREMQPGDVLIGVSSSGVHSNGFSLVRKILTDSAQQLDAPAPFARELTLAEALLIPTRLYVTSALAAVRGVKVKGLAHITGGGITENLPRILPGNLNSQILLGSWKIPAVFQWLAELGGVDDREMLRTFNCGIGLIVVVSAEDKAICHETLARSGTAAYTIGALAEGSGDPQVEYSGRLFA
ncbi:MAG TPA: phosphoribosylformylglycinamidine cyclo-ligase [Rhizomicrobium sp.]|jgi:phosphoribosylformylglycinamidine cyclo-ligase|nr:phosphoribosylformylglycinamidine cyclo-ligase [Rhizomicrobium sp.]